ncbi:hypothetical protein UY3_03959 [Chelonia mydas]|uniref:Uncharacterized protein n=1 Tax=Chelonia mydas TaxID=8469 RepID=M7BSX3_CHEMY|nr:hypothetical protein UY3_03959 [Chelonia mydas]
MESLPFMSAALDQALKPWSCDFRSNNLLNYSEINRPPLARDPISFGFSRTEIIKEETKFSGVFEAPPEESQQLLDQILEVTLVLMLVLDQVWLLEQLQQILSPYLEDLFGDSPVEQPTAEIAPALEPALAKVQKDCCCTADAVEICKEFQETLKKEIPNNKVKLQAVKKRMDQALTPSHFLANILNTKHEDRCLTDDEDATMT